MKRLSALVGILAAISTANLQAQLTEPSVTFPGQKAVQSQFKQDDQLKWVGTSKFQSTLNAGGKTTEISGRASFNLIASTEEIQSGIVRAKDFNLVYFDVPQDLISQNPDNTQRDTVGFVINKNKEAVLYYDIKAGVLKGKLEGLVDAAYTMQFARPQNDEYKDSYVVDKQPAVLQVSIDLEKPLQIAGVNSTTSENILKTRGRMSTELVVEQHVVADQGLVMPRFEIAGQATIIDMQYTNFFNIEGASRLCLQPVRVGRFSWNNWPLIFPLVAEYTGDGLPFGMPGATNQWRKADVIYTVKAWQTIFNSGYWIIDPGTAEETAFRGSVNDPDCVEIFFMDDWNPESTYGGGATWGSGTTSAKIMTSDGNADGGIDLTHLAHELGHALSLCHPGDSGCEARAAMNASSTGTLMCPSGWLNDNPAVNSVENEDNVSNPLLTFTLKLVSPGPDCTNSADCGACF